MKMLTRKLNVWQILRRFSTNKPSSIILGIETSCDDTGCAVVDGTGRILGESKHSQLAFHLRTGGINPIFAQELHRLHIEDVVRDALVNANLTVSNVDAIAVTNRPGIDRSLIIGTRYAKHLARKYQKPLIPIHHMEAHALTARMENADLSFPFLCLLASGGHCQLTLVRSVSDFILLGETLDSSPGACFDRISRALGLHHLPEYQDVNGGRAIELTAYKSQHADRFTFNLPLFEHRNCQFSFDGLRGAGIQRIEEIRQQNKIAADQMIPYYEDFCAAVLKTVTRHLLQRTQRAIQYCDRIGAFGFGENKRPRAFVFAGGVACNDFIYKALGEMVNKLGFKAYRCSKRLCSDNGVMIAWNGYERWNANQQFYRDLNIDSVQTDPFAELGISHVERVNEKRLKCEWVKVSCMETKTISLD